MNENNSRRSFLKRNALVGLGVIGIGNIAGRATVSEMVSTGNGGSVKEIKSIGDLNIEELREQYKKALFDNFLPNMDKYVIDHELGGFMCSVNILTRKLVSTNKRAWFEGRGMWTYSYLYNNLKKDPHYLEIVRKSRDFILPLLPPDGRFYISGFTKEGKPLSDVEGDIYGNLFVAEGLAEYAKASGEKKYLDQAKQIILSAVERYDRPDFQYDYKADTREKGPRILGHWMILLSVTTQILRQGADAKIESLADRCVEAIMKHHLNPEFHLLNEALNHDLKPLSDKVATQYGDIGHGCETLAFVMNYAVLRKDAKLFKESSEAFKRHVTVATDTVYGGHFHAMMNVDENIYALGKSRWVQEEIMNGALILIEHTGDQWALNVFAEMEAYVRGKFVRPEYAFIIDSGDRKMQEHSQVRAEHYHHPRQLMVSLVTFERILNRGKKPSGIFG